MASHDPQSELDSELKDLIIEARFNIRPGDNINGELLVERPDVRYEIEEYFKRRESQRLIELIKAREEKLKEERIKRNQSFCGCPMCRHHSDPYKLTQQSKESE